MAARLARHPFLAGMNRRQLALLTACATAVQFKKGQVIFRESEPADRFYLIETGKVIMESSAGLGDPRLGWSWMFPPHIWNFTARAVEPTNAIFFDGAILREYCEKDHSLGYEFLKRMSLVMYRRMQAARNKMLTISDTLQQGGAAAVHAGARDPMEMKTVQGNSANEQTTASAVESWTERREKSTNHAGSMEPRSSHEV